LIQNLIERGYKVYISLPESKENIYFSELGCKIINTSVDRRGVNPIKDIRLLLKYIRIMNNVKPDIIFSYTIKPNIYGSIAANLTKNKQINNITGTGGTFIKINIVSKLVKFLYKLSIKKSYKVYFQNSGDLKWFVGNNLVFNNYSLIPGSGVNLKQFQLRDYPCDNEIRFIYIGRIMRIKGIDQYLETALEIKKKYTNTKFYIAGFIEEEHYRSTINEYNSKGIVNYIGFQKDIKTWIEICHCTILPSHGGEGVPNVLLESAAMGRVCIASTIDGSKEVIDDKVTGYLFETGNTEDLTDKVIKFLDLSFEDKVKMGIAARTKVESEYDRQIVINRYLDEAKFA
jgi:glycosyltransferase involved in cell wall biosynthesis